MRISVPDILKKVDLHSVARALAYIQSNILQLYEYNSNHTTLIYYISQRAYDIICVVYM